MDIRPIKTEQDYNNSIRRIEELWGAKKGGGRPGTDPRPAAAASR